MQKTSFQPDDIYCVYCHAPAAGPCANCGALICGDCGELRGGAVQKVVVCKRCAAHGAGELTHHGWAKLWFFGIALAAVVFSVALLLESC